MHLRCVYAFTGAEGEILEIQRTDLGPDASLSDVFQWILCPRNSEQLVELEFEGMTTLPRQTRLFHEGELVFDSESAQFELLGYSCTFQAFNSVTVSGERMARVKLFLEAREHFKIEKEENPEARFHFRFLKPSDVQSFYPWLSDPIAIRHSLTEFYEGAGEAKVRKWFYRHFCTSKVLPFAIESSSGKLIGYAGLCKLNSVDRNAEYFIFLGDRSSWNQGIGTGVTQAILAHGFEGLGLHRISLTVSSDNPAAVRTYEKCGYVFEGKMREAFLRDGKASDKIVMGMLKSEWMGRGGDDL